MHGIGQNPHGFAKNAAIGLFCVCYVLYHAREAFIGAPRPVFVRAPSPTCPS